MSKEKYYIGALIKKGELFAMVYLTSEKIKLIENELLKIGIKIVFDQPYSFRELKDMGLHLPYYVRKGKAWVFEQNNNHLVRPELNRLQKLGFEIETTKQNQGLQRVLAELV